MNNFKISWYCMLIAAATLQGCATNESPKYNVRSSSIASGDSAVPKDNIAEPEETLIRAEKVETISPLGLSAYRPSKPNDMSDAFSAQRTVVLAVNELPLKDFIHNLFSDLLQKSYVLANEVAAIEDPVTLSIKEPISERQAFRLGMELLQKKGIGVVEKEGVFYLSVVEGQAQSAMGVGGNAADVPNVGGTVTQVVPLRYGNPTIEGAIASFVPVRVNRDQYLNTLFITGTAGDVIKALDIVKLLDAPANRGKFIRLRRFTFISPEEFSKKTRILLENEGVDNVGINEAIGKSITFVPIDNLGAVAVFSSNEQYLERALFWADQIDVAGDGVQKRYFIYHPAYARARDLGESIAALLGQSTGGNSSRDTQSAMGNQNSGQTSASAESSGGRPTGSMSVQNDRMSMTVDERSNTIVFYTQGSEYQTLLPMIKRLDVMPKQVLLEATIAEVTLSDDFKMGVEFAIKNGKLNVGNLGAMGVGKMGGLNLGYLDATDSIIARLSQSDQEVNVLSNPSIVVRDGVSASISVGKEIPTVSSTTQDPLLSDKQTTTITYRQTGLEFSIVPTINGQGLVVMQIKQNISNQADGSVVDGAPAIFRRTLETEVIAKSGQTVLLGGLISEDRNSANGAVPFLSELPVLGNLFKSKTKSGSKTELVLLITPRVIDATEQWLYINEQVRKGFKYLQIND